MKIKSRARSSSGLSSLTDKLNILRTCYELVYFDSNTQ